MHKAEAAAATAAPAAPGAFWHILATCRDILSKCRGILNGALTMDHGLNRRNIGIGPVSGAPPGGPRAGITRMGVAGMCWEDVVHFGI